MPLQDLFFHDLPQHDLPQHDLPQHDLLLHDTVSHGTVFHGAHLRKSSLHASGGWGGDDGSTTSTDSCSDARRRQLARDASPSRIAGGMRDARSLPG